MSPSDHYSYLVGVLIFWVGWVVCSILGKPVLRASFPAWTWKLTAGTLPIALKRLLIRCSTCVVLRYHKCEHLSLFAQIAGGTYSCVCPDVLTCTAPSDSHRKSTNSWSSSGLAVKTLFRERLHLGLQFFQPGRELRIKLLNVFKVT